MEHPPTADSVHTTLKRQQRFEIFTLTKKIKFSENLNFWQQNSKPGNGDLAEQLGEPTQNWERNLVVED